MFILSLFFLKSLIVVSVAFFLGHPVYVSCNIDNNNNNNIDNELVWWTHPLHDDVLEGHVLDALLHHVLGKVRRLGLDLLESIVPPLGVLVRLHLDDSLQLLLLSLQAIMG